MKSAKLASLLVALGLAACQSAPPPAPVAALPPSIVPARGIDLPTDASDVLSELKTVPIDFVARYYRNPVSRWPTLTAGEVQRLSALGKKIVTVWEWHSGDPSYFSYAAGYDDALNAYRQAKTVGQTAGSAIYFAVDFNANAEQLPRVDQYFRGVAAGFAAAGAGRPDYKIGVYGSGAVCDAMRRAGLAQYAWLSNSRAWTGASDYVGWNIRQTGRFGNFSFNHDSNEAKDDYGAFTLANAVSAIAAAPAAVASAAAAAVTAAAQAAGPPPAPQPDRSFAGLLKSWF